MLKVSPRLISRKQTAQLLAGPYVKVLADHEKALSDIYNLFAEIQRPLKSFWKDLANEELVHRTIIETMMVRFGAGTLQFKRPPFLYKAILESLEWVYTKAREVLRTGISIRDALDYAQTIEITMVESQFFEVLDEDDEETRKELVKLDQFNWNHIRRIEKEAGRLRWRLFGRRIYRVGTGPSAAAQPAVEYTPRGLVNRAATVQQEILDLLAELEEAVGSLYRVYCDCFKGSAGAHWHRLSIEEMDHAVMVIKVRCVLCDHPDPFSRVNFDVDTLRSELEYILDAEYEARNGRISLKKAVETAMEIERKFSDGRIYKSMSSDTEEFKQLVVQMIEMSKTHIAELSTLLVSSLASPGKEAS